MRCWNLSTRPAVSTNFCWPVKKGWQELQIPTIITGLVERVLITLPHAQRISASTYFGCMSAFIKDLAKYHRREGWQGAKSEFRWPRPERNPNSEFRVKGEPPRPKLRRPPPRDGIYMAPALGCTGRRGSASCRISAFGLPSDFGFRASDFRPLTSPTPSARRLPRPAHFRNRRWQQPPQ